MTTKTVKQFTVPCYDKPGALGKIVETLGKAGVNVTGISTYAAGPVAYITFTADPAEKVEPALKTANYQVFTNETLAIELPNKPGELGKVCQILGQEGINIQNLFGFSGNSPSATLVLSVDQYDKAEKLLAELTAAVA